MSTSWYKLPDLTRSSVLSRLKRVERVVQFPAAGQLADNTSNFGGSNFRTIAAWQVDRDGNINLPEVIKTSVTVTGGSGAVAWGVITGTLSAQTDLQAVLATIPGLSIGFVVNDGSTGTNVGPELAAVRAGSFTKSKIVVKASHASTDLTFTIKKNGTGIFTATVTHGAIAGALATTTFAGVTVAENDVFTLNITSGASDWKVTVELC